MRSCLGQQQLSAPHRLSSARQPAPCHQGVACSSLARSSWLPAQQEQQQHAAQAWRRHRARGSAAPTAATEQQLQQQQQSPVSRDPGKPAQDAAAAPASSSQQLEYDAAEDAPRWQLLSRTLLAGGVLEVVSWRADRCLRVWLPPGYSRADGAAMPYPVLYLNDGQNLFGDCPTLSGASWEAAQAAAGLIASGKLPPFLLVGLDHAGPLRSLEYTPYKPGTGPGGFRSDAASWPGGGVSDYLARLRTEVVPWVAGAYAASRHPDDLALGGSSFGGIAALAAGLQGGSAGGFGSLLVESPSLWLADEAFLRDVLAHRGSWPGRLYIGMGGAEFSGTRGGAGREHDGHFVRYTRELYRGLTQQGLGPSRLAVVLDGGGAHTEHAWAARLPAAMQFVAGGWWERWAVRYAGHLFCSSPRRLKAGLAGQLLFFNRAASIPLAPLPGDAGVQMLMGVNGWQYSTRLRMTPVQQLQALTLAPPQPLAAEVVAEWKEEHRQQQLLLALQQEQLRQQQRQQRKLAQERSGSGAGGGAAGPSAAAGEPAPAVISIVDDVAPLLRAILDQPPASCSIDCGGGDWWVAELPQLPADAYEINAVFSDAAEQTWDNCGGCDFFIPVRQPGDEADEAQQQAAAPGSSSSSSSSGGIGGGNGSNGGYDRGGGGGGVSSPASGRGVGGVVASVVLEAAAVACGDACGFLGVHAYADAFAAATAAANARADAAAAVAGEALYFCLPAVPVAGAPVSLYVNRARLAAGLAGAADVQLHMGFNGWTLAAKQMQLDPTSLWRGDGVDWWRVQFVVPPEASSADFVFMGVSDGGDTAYDNNGGRDYVLPVLSATAAAVAAAAQAGWVARTPAALPPGMYARSNGASSGGYNGNGGSGHNGSLASSSNSCSRSSISSSSLLRPPGFAVRQIESAKAVQHAGGTLEVLTLAKRAVSKGNSKQRWWDEKCLRVWLPPGFDAADAPPGGWPMLVMADGQNQFEDWMAHQGVSWGLGETAAALISAGSIPPCIMAAIDSAGPLRSFNYLPYPPGTGQGGFRGDAARWPGGGADDFLQRVTTEILPLLQQRYNAAQCSERLAFGGGSFAGVTALMVATRLPHVFGGVLVESPSLWVAEGRCLADLAGHSGRLPERLSLGCGTREYSATRDHERHDIDGLLLHQYHEAARMLQECGMRGPQRFKFVVDQDAGHHEAAWRWRLRGALEFIAQGWWNS